MSKMFENPKCDICQICFKTIEILDVYMKKVHHETPHIRIERRIKMATYAVNQNRNSDLKTNHKQDFPSQIKVFNCTECGLIFSTLNDKKLHEEKHRCNPQISQVTIKPQKNWLSKSLPNLKELLETIPLNCLLSEEDELK